MRSIAFIIPNLEMGGAEKALLTLANHWVNTADISIITFDSGKTFFKIDERIKIIPLHTTKNNMGFLSPLINITKRFRMLTKTIRELVPDVTIPFMDTSIIWTLFSRVFIKVPVLMVFQVTPSKAILKLPLRPLRILYKTADAAVILTRNMLKIFDRLKIKLPSQIFVIPNALSHEIVYKGSVYREDIILAVGRLAEQKQFDMLIKIFHQLQPTHWALWIVGEGPKRKDLENLIDNLSLQSKVKFWGAQKNVSIFYARAKIFALPSAYEGFPVVLCEAAANGCACVSFDCEVGPSDIIQHNVNGLLIEDQNEEKFLEALSQLINSPEDINRLSVKAKTIFEKLDIKNIVHKWAEAVEEVLKP